MKVGTGSLRTKATVLFSLGLLIGAVALWSSPNRAARADQAPMMSYRPPPINSTKAALGKLLFFDTTLSNPVGQSCGSCHSPDEGFTFPNSDINQRFGVATGAIPTRFGNRAVPTVAYGAFIAPGPPQYDANLTAYVGGLFWDGAPPTWPIRPRSPSRTPTR